MKHLFLVSIKPAAGHLHRYVAEMTWRFNRRDMRVGARMNDIFACVEGRLTYKELIA